MGLWGCSMRSLMLWLGLLSPPDFAAPVAVNAAYVINTQAKPTVQECCGLCKGGIITHGDGHKSPCPCPPDCKCKAKAECKDDKCPPKK
jgi:hypothetical protein